MSIEATELPTTGFVRIKQITAVIPVSRTSIWRWIKAGKFPKPIKLGENTTVFRVEDVRAWIDQQGKEGQQAA